MPRHLALVLASLALAAGSARAQPVTVGTYNFFWADAANAPITSATVTAGDTLSVRLFVRETGGNTFTGTRTATTGAFANQVVGGLAGFDSVFSVAAGGTSVVRLAPPANPQTGQRYAGVTASAQFGGTAGGFFQQNVAAFNDTGTAVSFAQPVAMVTQPSTYVRDTVAPNTPGSIFLYQIDFQTAFAGSTGGTTVLTGMQGQGSNFGYRDEASNLLVLDSTIGTASAGLTITVVPVPEPAALVGVAALGLAARRLGRRLA